MPTIEAEKELHMRLLSHYHDTMVEILNDQWYDDIPEYRERAMSRYLNKVDIHLERYCEKHEGGEHLDKRKA